MTFYLKEDLLSSFNKKTYALKGEKVTVISKHDNCYCVESENKIKFGVNESYLSSEKVNKEIKQNEEKTKSTRKSR